MSQPLDLYVEEGAGIKQGTRVSHAYDTLDRIIAF